MQGINRASMIELDDAPASSPDPMPSPVSVKPGEVSAEAFGRIMAQSDALTKAGFTLPSGMENGVTSQGFALGRRVVEWGDENLKASNSAFEALPETVETLETLRDRVKAEGRENVREVPLSRLKLADDGESLAFPHGEEWRVVGLTRTGWRHLADALAPSTGLVRYLDGAPAAVKVAVVREHGNLNAGKTVAFGVKRNVNARNLPKRTNAKGEAFQPGTLYRVASNSYTPYEPDMALNDVMNHPEFRSLVKGSRTDARYDGESARIRIVWHADHIPNAASGDTFKVALEFSLNDVKAGSVVGRLLAFRNECQNFVIVSEMAVTTTRMRHRGNVSRIAESVVGAIPKAQAAFGEAFLKPWNAAREERILDGFDGDAKALFEALVGAGLTGMSGAKEVQVARLMNAWAIEPGPTRADVVNALTRAAHTGGWWESIGEQTATEEAGGKLLYVRNLSGVLSEGFKSYHGE